MANRKYVNSDYEQVCSWINKRDFDLPCKEEFSTTGLIEDGLAAAFVYMTNSSVAIFGNAITNPDAPIQERQASLRQITNDLEKLAKDCGYKYVKIDTRVGSIEALVTDLGYLPLGSHKCFVKEIR